MKNSIQPFPTIATSPGWLPVAVSLCVVLSTFVALIVLAATGVEMVGWQ